MKRFIVLICLLFACNLLFAEIETIFERNNNPYFLELTKYTDMTILTKSNFLDLRTVEPTETKDTFIVCFITTEDFSKEKEMKKIIAKLAGTKKYYDYIKTLKLKLVDDDIEFENGQIFYIYYFEF